MGLVTPVIDNWSHIGGFFYGACCALSTIEPLAVSFFGVNSSAWAKIRSFTLRFGGLMLSMVLILVSTVALATMADPRESPCNSCRYISCVPFPIFQEDKWWYCDDCDFVTADLYKSGNGTSYSFIELTCPDESVETVDVYNDSLTEKDDVRQKLPTYCREHCDSVFK